jgi:hypothetical protein
MGAFDCEIDLGAGNAASVFSSFTHDLLRIMNKSRGGGKKFGRAFYAVMRGMRGMARKRFIVRSCGTSVHLPGRS